MQKIPVGYYDVHLPDDPRYGGRLKTLEFANIEAYSPRQALTKVLKANEILWAYNSLLPQISRIVEERAVQMRMF